MNARGHYVLGELLAETIRRQTGPGGPWSDVRIASAAAAPPAGTGAKAAGSAAASGARR